MSGKYIGDVCMATGTYKDKYGNTKKTMVDNWCGISK